MDRLIDRDIAELEHNRSIADNYRKLLDSASPAAERTREEERAATRYEERPAERVAEAPARPERQLSANSAARIADYNVHRAPKTKRVLFEDVTYNGQEVVMTMPVAAPVAAPVQDREACEDAMPTRRTMQMLGGSAAAQQSAAETEEEGVGFFASLSTRMKVALVTFAVVIFAALILICVNTSIIDSLDGTIAARETKLNGLAEQQRVLDERIAELNDPDEIARWAMEHGMVKD